MSLHQHKTIIVKHPLHVLKQIGYSAGCAKANYYRLKQSHYGEIIYYGRKIRRFNTASSKAGHLNTILSQFHPSPHSPFS
jgi:hypothetical protein